MSLLVIDMQKGLVDEDLYDYESFTENVRKLIDAGRDNNVEVIYFRHDAGPGS
ncbi:MAG: isochorismatase family protein, partial [Oscillospiraceae bacterium]|nr:isochorismatase family protein [Oscillospiraceae bacterium]